MSCNKTIKEIKTLVVVFKKTIMKVGETIIPAPIGVDIDPKTGEVKVPLKIKPLGDVVLKPEIVKNLLINQGLIKLLLIFKDSCPEPCSDVRKRITKEVIVPVQSVQEIDQLCPDDHIQEKVKIKAITVRGVPDNSIIKSACLKWNLIIKVILEVKLIVAREEIVLVPVLGKPTQKCKLIGTEFENMYESEDLSELDDLQESENLSEFDNILELLGETEE